MVADQKWRIRSRFRLHEWIDAISACQYDRSIKTTLTPIVSKLSDMRIVNAELEYLVSEPRKEFIIMIAPSIIKFQSDHFICGNTYRCVWALREYPTTTEEQAILRHLGEKDGVTLHIYTRHAGKRVQVNGKVVPRRCIADSVLKRFQIRQSMRFQGYDS